MKYKNNPFNIRYNADNQWRGQIAPNFGFCQFSKLEYGYRAAWILLQTYRSKYGCKTVSDFVSRWAPPTENDTASYVNLCLELFDRPDAKVDGYSDQCALLYAMHKMEQGSVPDFFEFSRTLKRAILID